MHMMHIDLCTLSDDRLFPLHPLASGPFIGVASDVCLFLLSFAFCCGISLSDSRSPIVSAGLICHFGTCSEVGNLLIVECFSIAVPYQNLHHCS